VTKSFESVGGVESDYLLIFLVLFFIEH